MTYLPQEKATAKKKYCYLHLHKINDDVLVETQESVSNNK
jgi:hypothetical protein